MFDHRHYVPILKTKQGEQWALQHLAQADRPLMTPVLEIHTHRSLPATDHITALCPNLVTAWGGQQPVFLDTCWLHPPNGNPSVITHTFAQARAAGLQAIPVVRITWDPASLAAVTAVVQEDQRGVMLRLDPSEIAVSHVINVTLQMLGLTPADVHLLVDYRNHPMQLTTHVPAISMLADWQTVTAAAAAFPASLSTYPLYIWHSLPRLAWQSWRTDLSAGGLPRKPAFGDYTIRDCGAAPSFGAPSTNIRYCRDQEWKVRLGGRLRDGQATDIFGICQSLVSGPHFDGPTFSHGDHVINEVAQQNDGPGAAQHWLQWPLNHHLTFVGRQIQSQIAP